MRTPSLALLAFAAAVACRSAPRPREPRGDVVFTLEGKVENGPFRFGAADLAALPQRTFTAREPRSGALASFEGVSLAAILQEAELQKDVDTLTIRGASGYAVPVPLISVKQLRPVLAGRAAGRPVAEWARGKGAALAGPLLAWPNVDAPGLESDPRARSWWASGVVAASVDVWERTYGRVLRTPAGASDEARLGAGVFATQCLACHRLRGVGGTVGPDLTRALGSRSPDAFAASVRDHARAMDGPAVLEAGGEALRRVARYLEIMQTAPPPPEEPKTEEPRPPEPRPPPFGPPRRG